MARELHDFDGIQEEDNRLPRWWLGGFLLTIVFGYGYWFWYHVVDRGELIADRYQADVAGEARRAAAMQPMSDELLLGLLSDDKTLAEGEKVFREICATCHGAAGEGKIGANLTDAFWLHGNKPIDIHKVIAKGFAEKGMPAWETQLGPQKVRAVAVFVLTLRGKNLPGKEPQGERVE